MQEEDLNNMTPKSLLEEMKENGDIDKHIGK